LEQTELLTRIGMALAIGFLIGVERGWQERDEGEGGRTAGLRTFALIGLAGGLWALLAKHLGEAAFAAGFIAFAAAITLYRWRESEREGSLGATTLIAALLTFGLGAYAAVGDMTVAAAAGVATAVLLASKSWLHAWVKALSWPELRASLILLAMTFLALPLLPNRGFGPNQALNPHSLWLMAIAIAGVSFIGYVAIKVAGQKYGVLIAGVAGGLVSSTVATIDMARRARAGNCEARTALAGALAASATMFVRVGVIVGLFGPALEPVLAPALVAGMLVLLAVALLLARPWQRSEPETAHEPAQFANPFEFRAVVGFAALLAFMLVVSKALAIAFGGRGAVALAAVSGLADVDAITLSMTGLAGSAVTPTVAAVAILVAISANSVAKSCIALAIGGRRFGLAYAAASGAALIAAGVVTVLASWYGAMA
jgi:uncharacterized membrane protein (DUF4010 family)